MNHEAIEAMARSLRQSLHTGVLASTAGAHELDLVRASAVAAASRRLAVAEGDRVVGYKIGLTSPEARRAFGAQEPAMGYLLESTVFESDISVSVNQLPNPLIEVEIAFILNTSLDDLQASPDAVMRATGAVAPALEIVDSRWEGGPVGLPMLVADNTNAASAVLGKNAILPRDLSAVGSVLVIGSETIVGTAKTVLGNPAEAVAWLARHLAKAGTPLQAGDIVLSGTLSAPTPLGGAGEVFAQVDGIGSVRAKFH